MGACYVTEGEFNLKNENQIENLRQKILSIIDSSAKMQKYSNVNWGINRLGHSLEETPISELLQLVFTGYGQSSTNEVMPNKGGYYIVGAFNASYGWSEVMENVLLDICCFLDDGSWLYIEPDNDYWKYEIKDGKAVIIDYGTF